MQGAFIPEKREKHIEMRRRCGGGRYTLMAAVGARLEAQRGGIWTCRSCDYFEEFGSGMEGEVVEVLSRERVG